MRWWLDMTGLVICLSACGLGDIPVADRSGDAAPPDASTPSGAVLVLGRDHTCAADETHALRCWGKGSEGQLGNGERSDVPSATSMVSLAGVVGGLAAGDDHTCATTTMATGWCWGANAEGQLGVGDTEPRLVPTALVRTWATLSAAVRSTCGVGDDGTLWCWGDNSAGQLGTGETGSFAVSPTRVGTATDWTSVSLGERFACGTRGTELFCWGANEVGQLGLGDTTSRPTPTSLGIDVLVVDAGASHACAVGADGSVSCWGANERWQVGAPPTPWVASPTVLGGLADVVGISMGSGFGCAITRVGELSCWGAGRPGLAGGSPEVPTAIPLGAPATLVAAGDFHVCAFDDESGLFCWGDNDHGELGAFGTVAQSAPVAVTDW